MSNDNVLSFPPENDARRSSGGGGGSGNLLERITRLEIIVDHVKEVGAKKEDVSNLELTMQKAISDAMEKIDQKHTTHYRWIIGVLVSLLLASIIYFTK
uniref:Haemolysin XhlA n=1 Tax=Candidatus Kentrum sp. FW TaxID=2126338 RepID=A0A450TP42_9GAMM|nr:MAG: hypothetical protein BECKFW1821C_GA0114237_101931 [Candidatus Kentron sp. FW]